MDPAGGIAKDFRLRPHVKDLKRRSDDTSSSSSKKSRTEIDRISSLPDEIVRDILALLPTKDAAAVCVLSKKILRLLSWMPSIDLDDSPISHCLKRPHLIDRFKIFTTFVDKVLGACQSPQLSRFRLHFGGDSNVHSHCCMEGCDPACRPYLNPQRIISWICFPITRPRGVREIDLHIHVRVPPKLPSVLFTCDTLEVLKLDVNFQVDQACTTMSSFRLPNLKVLKLRSILFPDDDFLTRLVSGCPSLEELDVEGTWGRKHGNFISISSPSLKRLVLSIYKEEEDKSSDYLSLDTPNLEYFKYIDNLALQYFIRPMLTLAKACICPLEFRVNGPLEASFQSALSLVQSASCVSHLSLLDTCVEALDFDELKNQLPVFPNLRYLELACYVLTKWDIVLLQFLKCSPVLETLCFPTGFITSPPIMSSKIDETAVELERQLCSTHTGFGSTTLKKIVVSNYWGSKREVALVGFLLRCATVLEELVVHKSEGDTNWLESTLKSLPRASITCSIQALEVLLDLCALPSEPAASNKYSSFLSDSDELSRNMDFSCSFWQLTYRVSDSRSNSSESDI